MNYINLFINEKGEVRNLGEEPTPSIRDAIEEIESEHVNNGLEVFQYVGTLQFNIKDGFSKMIDLQSGELS